MDARRLAVLRRGIEAGVLASVPQVILPKVEEKLFLPGHETADLGPRLIQAMARRTQRRLALPEDVKWLGAAFHFAYAAAWGAAYGLAYERRPTRPWLGGLLLAGLIHGITFPRWGGAVLVGAERKPRDRSWRMEAVLVTAPLVFGMMTALLYGRGPRRTLPDRLRSGWRRRRQS